VTFAYVCTYACVDRCICIRARALSSNPIDLCTVMTCECSQLRGMTALLWASERGHTATVRVLVELGASVEAVDKVNIHAHALAHTCCIKHVSGSMKRTIIIMSHARVYMYVYTFICRYVCMYIHMYVCIYVCIYVYI
jgi:hypothetical protein